MDASRVYVRALALGCFYGHISTGTFRRALTGQLRGDKECPFSGVTKSSRVWRKVPESGARSVTTGMRQLTQMGASEVLMVAVEAQAVAAPVRSARSVEVSEDAVEALVSSARSGLVSEGAVGVVVLVVSEDAVEALVWSARPVVVSGGTVGVDVLIWCARPVVVSEDAVEARYWWRSRSRSRYWSGPPD